MSFPHEENLLKHIFWQKWWILNALQLQKLENANFTHFFTRPLGENYSNSSFDKSKGLNNQEAEKMKLICSNHIFEPKLSNHVLQIDVDLIEKLIPCSWQGGPFEARLARLNFHKKYFLKHNSDAPSGARLAARSFIIIKIWL